MDDLTKALFARNYGVINEQEQSQLAQAKVTVIGAGGVGGITLISLARMGVGHIHVIDMDTFEASNINRQMLSAISRTGQYKAHCAKETLLDINPHLDVTCAIDKVVEHNALESISGADVVIDATDNLISRVIIHRAAQKAKIPSVWIAVTPPFRGGVMTFSDETPPYEQVLRHPSYQQELTPEIVQQVTAIKNQRAKNSIAFGAREDWAHAFIAGEAPWAVLCPVANMVGLLASFEAFKILLGRDNLKPTWAPSLIKIDLAQAEMVSVVTPADGTWDNEYL